MSATRLLVLGAVRGFGRAHGYLVRNELVSWGAGEWANVKWGSLYHALRKLTGEGMLTATEVAEPHWRIDYELTEAGDTEFFRLLREAIREPEPRPDTLAAALSLLPALSRPEAIVLLAERLAALETGRDSITEATKDWGEPAHVRELFGLWVHSAAGGADWTRGVLGRLKDGEYVMAGEIGAGFGNPGSWQVPDA